MVTICADCTASKHSLYGESLRATAEPALMMMQRTRIHQTTLVDI